MQVVLPLGSISPPGAADEGVDAVSADQNVGLDDLAAGHPHKLSLVTTNTRVSS